MLLPIPDYGEVTTLDWESTTESKASDRNISDALQQCHYMSSPNAGQLES